MAVLTLSCSQDGVLTGADEHGVLNAVQEQGGDAAILSEKLQLSMSSDAGAEKRASDDVGLGLQERMTAINEALAAAGYAVRVQKAELSLADNAPADAAAVVFANDRRLRLTSRWVPGDTRREADGNNITYLADQTFRMANGASGPINSEPAVDTAFGTWDGVTCSNLDIVKRADTEPNPNFILALFGLADINTAEPFAADITTTGFLPGFVFDLLAEDGSQFILGVTWTLVFVTDDEPTDVDNNGFADTGLKEIWYNNAFTWTDTGQGGTDIETVALHENGHAVELGHFGRVHATFSPHGGRLHVSPRAVMNAFILGTLRQTLGTDVAAYCGIFGAWPTPHS